MRTDASSENLRGDFNPCAFAKVVYHRIGCPQIESFRFIGFSFVFNSRPFDDFGVHGTLDRYQD
jgi:hypothetical protein